MPIPMPEVIYLLNDTGDCVIYFSSAFFVKFHPDQHDGPSSHNDWPKLHGCWTDAMPTCCLCCRFRFLNRIYVSSIVGSDRSSSSSNCSSSNCSRRSSWE